MKLIFFIFPLFLIHQGGQKTAKIIGLDANYVSVTMKPNETFNLPVDHLFIKSPKVGDSVWLVQDSKFGPMAVYRDSNLVKSNLIAIST